MGLNRRKSGGGETTAWGDLAKETFVWDYPLCLEFVCRQYWEPDVPRLTGTIMLMIDRGVWKVWAHDRDGQESLFVSGSTVDEALRSLEGHLRHETGEWRPDRAAGTGNGRKRS